MPCRLFCLRRPLAMRLSMVGRGALCSAMVKVAQQLRGGRGTSRPKAVSHGFTHEYQVQVSCFAAPVSTAGGTGPSTTFEQPQVGLYREVTASMTDLRQLNSSHASCGRAVHARSCEPSRWERPPGSDARFGSSRPPRLGPMSGAGGGQTAQIRPCGSAWRLDAGRAVTAGSTRDLHRDRGLKRGAASSRCECAVQSV